MAPGLSESALPEFQLRSQPPNTHSIAPRSLGKEIGPDSGSVLLFCV